LEQQEKLSTIDTTLKTLITISLLAAAVLSAGCTNFSKNYDTPVTNGNHLDQIVAPPDRDKQDNPHRRLPDSETQQTYMN
jgi:hypothetical protein